MNTLNGNHNYLKMDTHDVTNANCYITKDSNKYCTQLLFMENIDVLSMYIH